MTDLIQQIKILYTEYGGVNASRNILVHRLFIFIRNIMVVSIPAGPMGFILLQTLMSLERSMWTTVRHEYENGIQHVKKENQILLKKIRTQCRQNPSAIQKNSTLLEKSM